jgi:16S rRNA (cytosine1402-N4)-methyltransferase
MHIPVLLNEILSHLRLTDGDVYIDGTLGAGGHASAICKKFPGISIVGFDADFAATERAKDAITFAGCVPEIVHSNFRHMDTEYVKLGLLAPRAILLDLGVSSFQLDDDRRGFSFKNDDPLVMTLKDSPGPDDTTARDIVNSWEEENISAILFGFGEERYSKRIARRIVEARAVTPIETTGQLVEIIKSAVPAPYRHGRLHPATRTFQALRIAVNDELGALTDGIEKAFVLLKPEGQLLVISFHSLEDRIVKHFFKKQVELGNGELITKKPIIPREEEIQNNPRARSAKLRIITKL